MSAELKRLPTARDETNTLPEFEIGIAMNLGGERQITLRSPVKEAITAEEANRRMDGLMKVAERQRSLIEIRVLEEELSSKTDALENVWKVRQREAEGEHAKKIAEIEKSVMTLATRIEQAKIAGGEQHANSGRRGNYNPDNDNRLKRLKDDHAAALARVTQAENEHKQHVQTIAGNVEKLDAELREIGRQLDRHRKNVE